MIHTLEHRDKRTGNGYRGFCAYCPSLAIVAPKIAVVVYNRTACALYNVQEGAEQYLYVYYTDLKEAGVVKGRVHVCFINTGD